jgi:uncharacterized membrane protein YphA (DoxX/SURF4 family)
VILKVLFWICRLAIGGLFIYAGFTKGLYPIEEPFLFAIAISSYQLLPDALVVFVSRSLPWFEIFLGVFVLIGWQLRWFASTTALLLAAFIAAMGITYARGIEADCGCFGLGEPISPATLTRDSFILLMAVFVAVQAWRATPAAEPVQS